VAGCGVALEPVGSGSYWLSGGVSKILIFLLAIWISNILII